MFNKLIIISHFVLLNLSGLFFKRSFFHYQSNKLEYFQTFLIKGTKIIFEQRNSYYRSSVPFVRWKKKSKMTFSDFFFHLPNEFLFSKKNSFVCTHVHCSLALSIVYSIFENNHLNFFQTRKVI